MTDPWGADPTPPPDPQQQPYAGYLPSGPPGYPPPAYVPDHPKATTALVLGLLGLLLCQVLAPFAWQTGKRTLEEIDAAQGRLGGRGQAQAGYVMGIIGTVLLGLSVLLVVGLLVLAIGLSVSSNA